MQALEEQYLDLKSRQEIPNWLRFSGFQTLTKGYLQEGEMPKDMWYRVAKTASRYIKGTEAEQEVFKLKVMQYLWNGWLCLATPVASNMGTNRGLPISCYSSLIVEDTMDGIMTALREVALQTKAGGGTATYWGNVRARGATISAGGESEGIVPFLKMFDSMIIGTSQGNVRRGAHAAYIPIYHGDAEEFIDMRRPTVEAHRQCLNLHHGVTIPDSFMEKLIAGEGRERELWRKLIKARLETGEPYIMFEGAANKGKTEKIYSSQLCNEIFLPANKLETPICCLSSLNLLHYDKWRDTDLVQIATTFLGCVLQEFIEKAAEIPGLEKCVAYAERRRSVGLGVLGWHSLLQSKGIPFECYQAMQLNNEIWRHISSEAAKPRTGSLERLAVAPTVSNALIAGGYSQGIEPIAANMYMSNTAKTSFVYKNEFLTKILQDLGKDDPKTWASINEYQGSVQHLKFLTAEQKEVFKTAREINQHAVIQQAAQRQQYIDQGQSLNLFFTSETPLKHINDVHVEAWQLGCKGLYYCRTESSLKGTTSIKYDECKSCEG